MKVKYYLLLIVLLGAISSCKKIDRPIYEPDRLQERTEYRLTASFAPGFNMPIGISISVRHNVKSIMIFPAGAIEHKVTNFPMAVKIIPDNIYKEFLDKIKKIDFVNLKPEWPQLVQEGVLTNVQFNDFNGHVNRFSFFNYNKIDSIFRNAVLVLTYDMFKNDPQGEFIQEIAQDLHIKGLIPSKKIPEVIDISHGYTILSASPYFIKIGKSLYNNLDKEIESLFKKLPVNEHVIFDISDMEENSREIDSIVRAYCDTNKRTYWITNSSAFLTEDDKNGYLMDLGVDEDRIFETIDDALVEIKKFDDFFNVKSTTPNSPEALNSNTPKKRKK